MIKIDNLSKSFIRNKAGGTQTVDVIAALNLDIHEGEFVTVFGPNGCGKSTLLLCVAGVEKPTEGVVTINGTPSSTARTGFVFQNYREALLPWRSCLSNIAFPLELEGWTKSKRRDEARKLVSSLGLHIDLASYPYEQSGGQQQLIAISRALISSPEALIMDEPLSALDIKARLAMRSTIENIWLQTNKTILYVSHDVDEAVYLSDRIVILSERPAKIVEIIKNHLPRPRKQFVGTPSYNAICNQVLKIFETLGSTA